MPGPDFEGSGLRLRDFLGISAGKTRRPANPSSAGFAATCRSFVQACLQSALDARCAHCDTLGSRIEQVARSLRVQPRGAFTLNAPAHARYGNRPGGHTDCDLCRRHAAGPVGFRILPAALPLPSEHPSMAAPSVFFVIPTYRLRDVGETVESYDEHFWRNGHSVRMIVFDDSSPVNQEKYYPLLEQTRTHNELYYVGPQREGAVPRLPQQPAARQAAGRPASRTCSAPATAATATTR